MTQQDPKVSIIVNTFNRAEYLRKNLESLQKLHYSNKEIIVVNGPSTDNTTEVLNEFVGIKKFKINYANLGKSRNFGIMQSNGEYLAFIDDDATASEYWLDELLEFMRSEKLAGAGGIVYDVPSRSVLWERVMSDKFGSVTSLNSQSEVSKSSPTSEKFLYLAGCNMMFRKDALMQIGGFNRYLRYGYANWKSR